MSYQGTAEKIENTPKKHPGGRPLKFQSPEELQEKIDAYFESCHEKVTETTKSGSIKEYTIQSRPYTVTGLAVYLDTTRDVLIDYQNRDEYSNAIKKAKAKIHNYAEEYLYNGKNVAGGIFVLKNNFGWKDKVEHEHTSDSLTGLLEHLNNKPIDITPSPDLITHEPEE
jgi:DNA-binding Lrp family transcriptional regulator